MTMMEQVTNVTNTVAGQSSPEHAWVVWNDADFPFPIEGMRIFALEDELDALRYAQNKRWAISQVKLGADLDDQL